MFFRGGCLCRQRGQRNAATAAVAAKRQHVGGILCPARAECGGGGLQWGGVV